MFYQTYKYDKQALGTGSFLIEKPDNAAAYQINTEHINCKDWSHWVLTVIRLTPLTEMELFSRLFIFGASKIPSPYLQAWSSISQWPQITVDSPILTPALRVAGMGQQALISQGFGTLKGELDHFKWILAYRSKLSEKPFHCKNGFLRKDQARCFLHIF